MPDVYSADLIKDATATVTGEWLQLKNMTAPYTFQAAGLTTAGAGAATVIIEVSNDGVTPIIAGTITLTLDTTAAADGFAMNARWKYARARLSAISGTGAKASAQIAG